MKRFLIILLTAGLVQIFNACGTNEPEFHGEMNIKFTTSSKDTKNIETK